MKKSLLGKIWQNHALAMILCCAIPLTFVLILSLSGSIGSWSYYGLMLLCPLLHFLMMRGHGHSADHEKRLLVAPAVVEDNQRIKGEP